jgi:F-type H+-transporting ATPase subunit a
LENQIVVFQKVINGFPLVISQSMIVQWVILILFAIMSIILTRNLKRIPGKKQSALELIVVSIKNVVADTMGKENVVMSSYIGALGVFLLLMNLTGLVGISPPTTDYNIALGMALTTFIMVQAFAIKKVGIGHYFIGLGKPMLFMVPMNLLERVILPLSLSLRLFGNITAAAIIMEMIYKGLGGLGFFAQIGLPIPAHLYFDIFDGGVQMVVFTMLTMVNIKIIAEH